MTISSRAAALTLAAAVATTVVLTPGAARADEAPGVSYDLTIDAGATALAAVLIAGSEIVVKDHFALNPTWTGADRVDSPVRNALLWNDRGAARIISSVTVGAAGVAGLGLTALASVRAGTPSDFWIDALLIAEATTLDAAFNQLVKFTIRRSRPCAADYSCPNDARGDATHAPTHAKDSNLSFYSEHTSVVFALAASAGTVAKLRGHELAPIIWISTAALGVATAYLRIAANEHYLTDVVTGAAMGTLFGVGVPALFHTARKETGGRATVMILPTSDGATLTYAVRW